MKEGRVEREGGRERRERQNREGGRESARFTHAHTHTEQEKRDAQFLSSSVLTCRPGWERRHPHARLQLSAASQSPEWSVQSVQGAGVDGSAGGRRAHSQGGSAGRAPSFQLPEQVSSWGSWGR